MKVLLVDLLETRVMLPLLDDLELLVELLVELRLVFSSSITLEAKVLVESSAIVKVLTIKGELTLLLLSVTLILQSM